MSNTNYTTKEFINKAKLKHFDRYDYSLVEYINAKTKVKIICKKHGVFEQSPNNHLSGNNCPSCTGKIITTKIIIDDLILSRGNRYDYSKVKYIGSSIKITIVCREHGEFKQNIWQHKNGANCFECVKKQRRLIGFSQDEIISKFHEVHGDTYDYSLVKYTGIDNQVTIICRLHGKFCQSPYIHKKVGAGCPICTKVTPFSRSRYVSACKRTNGESSLYIIKMSNDGEVFYKVGITNKTVKQRFPNAPYNIEVIKVLKYDAAFIYDLENQIHRLLSKYKYLPKIKFGGSALECFNKIPKSILKMVDLMNSDTQLQLIA